MKLIKFTSTLCVALMALHGAAFAGGEGWSSDFAAAKKQAAESKKDLLIDFTGSDWCGWCKKLVAEVFSHDAFKAGVKDTFVLVELDFPRDKSKLSKETQQQNKELGAKYGVKGFPTILLCDAEGRPYAKTGYQKDGPESYVAHLNKLREKKTKRDEAFASAEKATGVEKAKALMSALEAMSLDEKTVSSFYGDIAEQIKAADPNDEAGFGKKASNKQRLNDLEKGVQEFLGSKIQPLMQAKEFDKALAEVKTFIKENPSIPEEIQVGMLMNIGLAGPMTKGDSNGAMSLVDDVAKTYPASDLAKNVDGVKATLKAKLDSMPKAEDKPKDNQKQ